MLISRIHPKTQRLGYPMKMIRWKTSLQQQQIPFRLWYSTKAFQMYTLSLTAQIQEDISIKNHSQTVTAVLGRVLTSLVKRGYASQVCQPALLSAYKKLQDLNCSYALLLFILYLRVRLASARLSLLYAKCLSSSLLQIPCFVCAFLHVLLLTGC